MLKTLFLCSSSPFRLYSLYGNIHLLHSVLKTSLILYITGSQNRFICTSAVDRWQNAHTYQRWFSTSDHVYLLPRFILHQALNQLFEKIMALDIDERHLLRLGHGEEELETEKDFSRWGQQGTGAERTHTYTHTQIDAPKQTEMHMWKLRQLEFTHACVEVHSTNG